MITKYTRTDVLSFIIVHKDALSQAKKDFVIQVLNVHGVDEAMVSLYTMLFVVKSDKELLTFRI